MNSKKYRRTSTNTTISIFYEQENLKKFNYEPPYQRDYNVWNDEQKSFLIDSIMKNFPMPPIFLHQIIDKGKTRYDVIDGKQRLTTIIGFIEDKVNLPNDFGVDEYGYAKMNGLKYSEIEKLSESDDIVKDFLDTFWSYTINIEYIEKPNEKVVDRIFDRLNRGGERLNPTELRNAKYYDTAMLQEIIKLSKEDVIARTLSFMDSVRMENIGFVTEIFLLVCRDSCIAGESSKIDSIFKQEVEKMDVNKAKEIGNVVINIFNIYDCFELDLRKYLIEGPSHMYALMYLAYQMHKKGIVCEEQMKKRLNEFYSTLRSKGTDERVMAYSESMQSQTKGLSSRNKRVKALCQYMMI